MARRRSDGVLRFNDTIKLITKIEGAYNPKTGKVEGSVENEEEYSCLISKMSRQRIASEYGSYSKSINTVIVQGPIDGFHEKCYLNNSEVASMILADSKFKQGVLFVEGGSL